MAADALSDRLRQLDSCAVSDALDRLGLRGAVAGLRPMWACPRMTGRVVTATIVPLGQQRPGAVAQPPRHLGTAAIEAAEAGEIIVVEHGGRDSAAAWGGILSLAAKLKGIGGVIVDGACRDVDESRDLGFPVYARCAVPLTARGRVVEDAFNEPVMIASMRVRPGDLVIADWSGVVFIAAERAEQIIASAESIAAREAEMAAALRAGRSVVEVMGASYESMLARPSD